MLPVCMQAAECVIQLALVCRRWQAAKEAEVEGQVGDLSLDNKQAEDVEKRLPGGKVKKKASKEIVLEVSTRSKKKSVTTVLGEPSAKTAQSYTCRSQCLCCKHHARQLHAIQHY